MRDDLAEVRRAAYEWLARLDDAEGLAERGLGDAVPGNRNQCGIRPVHPPLSADSAWLGLAAGYSTT